MQMMSVIYLRQLDMWLLTHCVGMDVTVLAWIRATHSQADPLRVLTSLLRYYDYGDIAIYEN